MKKSDMKKNKNSARRTAMNPPGVAKPLKPHYSNCVRVGSGPLLFISGQVALDSGGKLVGKGDVCAQAKQVLENIRKIVEANDARMDDIVKVTVYVRNIKAFETISDIRHVYFPKDGPASAIVEVSALADPEFLVEIEAVAVVP